MVDRPDALHIGIFSRILRWTGLENYVYLFVDDSLFLKAFTNTLTYAVIVGPVSYLMSYFFAWFINQVPDKVRPLYVLAFYAPALTSGVAMSVVWAVMFSNDSTGYLNSVLLNLGLIYGPIQLAQDVNYIMPVIIIVALWSSLEHAVPCFCCGLPRRRQRTVRCRCRRWRYLKIPEAAVCRRAADDAAAAFLGGYYNYQFFYCWTDDRGPSEPGRRRSDDHAAFK